MKDRNPSPSHSVGKGAQREQHNSGNEESYVKNPNEKDRHDLDGDINDEDYLNYKWKKIADDFRREYNVDVDDETYRGESFAKVLESLKEKTGKSSEDLKQEIHNWKHK